MIPQNINLDNSLESPYKYIVSLIEAGNNLISYFKEKILLDNDLTKLFVTLSYLERVIDSYRVLLPQGSSMSFSEDKDLVESELDKLRSEIWEIRKLLSDKDIESALDSAGEQFKLRFREI